MRTFSCVLCLVASLLPACSTTPVGIHNPGTAPMDATSVFASGPDLTVAGGDLATCQNGGTITGRVLAPNGLDPVPGAVVYVADGPVADFPAMVTCDLCTKVPASLAKTQSITDGTFALLGVPDGDITLVIQLGRFRRVLTLHLDPCETLALSDPQLKGTRLPHEKAEQNPRDSIPRLAVATGDYDQIECVLKRMGIAKFDLFEDRGGVNIPPTVGTLASLLGNRQKLLTYDVLFANCTDNQFESLVAQKTIRDNLTAYAAMGGRVYATDWAYDLIEQIPAFSPYMCFVPQRGGQLMCGPNPEPPQSADSNDPYDTKASIKDPVLADWLALFPNVIDGQKQVQVNFSFVIIDSLANDQKTYPSKLWVEGNTQRFGVKPMTVTFDFNQCGRVHFSVYNTEPNGVVPDQERFPNCKPNFSPQERILEYLVFQIAGCIETSHM